MHSCVTRRCTLDRTRRAQDPSWNATLRTTCVATMLDAGHATNALPQRARAIINCRIFPGVSAEAVRAKLEELVADPEVTVTTLETRGPTSAPPLTPAVLGPIEKLTDSVLARRAGAADTAGGCHGRRVHERRRNPDLRRGAGIYRARPRPHPRPQRVRRCNVQDLLEGREFLYRLVKIYAEPQK
jgi:acetylornithine deacetylase/succinyl-diaminopimelate desuccinylase-like protein